jgi:hypothetical protein
MKSKTNLLSLLIILSAVLNYSALQAQHKTDIKPAYYQLDIKKSKLYWTAPKNKHNGFILFNSGFLNNISSGWPTSGIFSINMNSVKSLDEATPEGRKKVDNKLRSDDFFAVVKYPTATMVVSRIAPEANGSHFKVHGELKIRDITKPIEFTAIMKQTGNSLTAVANTNISRANFNVGKQKETSAWDVLARLQNNLIANDIPIKLELVFVKK